jgi:hypothetical protein
MNKVGNTTINNMQINVFLNNECKDAMNLTDFIDSMQLSVDDLLYTRDNGYVKGISNILVRNLQDLKPMDRPIHCSNPEKLQFYVKDDNQWDNNTNGQKVNQTIDSITQKQIQKIKEWEAIHPNWDKSDEGAGLYMEMVKEVMGGMNIIDKHKNYNLIKKEVGESINIKTLM